jgi:hypothetical protein
MAITGGNEEVMRDPTAGGHLSPPREVNQFGRRPDATTVTASAKTQPVSGDGVSGAVHPPMKNAGAPPAVKSRTSP